MDSRLLVAAQEGDIDCLYVLLGEDTYMLDKIENVPFADTPLHISASSQQFDFTLELMALKPSLARKLNQKGLSPMHLAVANGDLATVKGLLALDKELLRLRGSGGLTPLHCAAAGGRSEILKEMLRSYPDAIADLTSRGHQTVLHLAAEAGHFKAFGVCVLHIDLYSKEDVFLLKDKRGRTASHLTVLDKQTKMIDLLLTHYMSGRVIGLYEEDEDGQSAVDTASHLPRTEAVRVSIIRTIGLRPLVMIKQWLIHLNKYDNLINNSDAQNAVLVVAALINAVTFQVGINPPGGYWQDTITNTNNTNNHMPPSSASGLFRGYVNATIPHVAGTPVIGTTRPMLFQAILIATFLGFMMSFGILYFLTKKLPLRRFVLAALGCMTVSYLFSLYSTSVGYKENDPNNKSQLTPTTFGFLVLLSIISLLGMFISLEFIQLNRRIQLEKLVSEAPQEVDLREELGNGAPVMASA